MEARRVTGGDAKPPGGFAKFARNRLIHSHWPGLKPIEGKAIFSCFYEGKSDF
jgi:hypothetical protein